jgi:hypothetical protein
MVTSAFVLHCGTRGGSEGAFGIRVGGGRDVSCECVGVLWAARENVTRPKRHGMCELWPSVSVGCLPCCRGTFLGSFPQMNPSHRIWVGRRGTKSLQGVNSHHM